MKIIVTGTHFTPAQAVIKELKKSSNVYISYIGRNHTLEGDKSISTESIVLKKMDIKFIPLIAGRLRRVFSIYTLISLLKIPVGFVQSFFILLNEAPDVTLSFGGYVALPVVINSWLLSIPVIIHEQTIVSGISNSIGSLFANKIALSFKNNELSHNSKVFISGNPVREEVINPRGEMSSEIKKIVELSHKQKLPVILITGGNQGSHAINLVVEQSLEQLTKFGCVIHQTGDSKYKDFETLTEVRKNLPNPERYYVSKWIDENDFGWLLKNINLAVSRAGINTLIELGIAQVPVLIIPLPFIFKNEQVINAKYFKNLGLGEIIYQKDLDKEKFLEMVKQMLKSKYQLKSEAKDIFKKDAANILALETLLLGDRKQKYLI